MEYNYDLLKNKIKEKCKTQTNFAKALGIGRVSLSQRMNNILEFSQQEMHKSCDILCIQREEIPIYFFDEKVQKRELTS